MPDKSTNVRMLLVRRALKTAAAISPSLAAMALERLFLATRRYPTPERERVWLENARETSFSSGGKRLAAWSWGSGPSTVLLAHGWEGRASQLGAFVSPLLAAGFRVVAFDGPGHGASSGRTSSLVEMAGAIRDASTTLGPFHGVVAHSAGAAATAIALANGLRLERVVFIAPPTDLGAFLFRVAALLGLPRTVAERTQRRIETRFGVRWEELRTERIARSMTAPLLVVHDRHDPEVAFDNAERLVAAWRGTSLVATKGLGHRRILRDDGVVDRSVRFLEGEVLGAELYPVPASASSEPGRASCAASSTRFRPSSFAR